MPLWGLRSVFLSEGAAGAERRTLLPEMERSGMEGAPERPAASIFFITKDICGLNAFGVVFALIENAPFLRPNDRKDAGSV